LKLKFGLGAHLQWKNQEERLCKGRKNLFVVLIKQKGGGRCSKKMNFFFAGDTPSGAQRRGGLVYGVPALGGEMKKREENLSLLITS